MSTEQMMRVMADLVSFTIVGATLAKLLPPTAALVSIFWMGFQFYHSEPVKAWRLKRKQKYDSYS
jgi:hypothetical protein